MLAVTVASLLTLLSLTASVDAVDRCKARGGWCVTICLRGNHDACAKGQLVGGLCGGRPTRRCCIGDGTGPVHRHRPSKTQRNRPSKNCLKCICKAGGCKEGNCVGNICGPYQITWAYWADCGKPGGTYAACATRKRCSEKCVMGYIKKYGKGRPKTCESYARLHKGGPWASGWVTNVFWQQVAACCKGQRGGC